MIPTIADWKKFCSALGVKDDAQYETLKSLYSQPDRYYHNFDHIGDCLAQFNTVRRYCDDAQAIECAIWFHDAVYDSKAKDNEEQSAVIEVTWLKRSSVPEMFCANVEALILATRHKETPTTYDSQVLVDVDLSILGRDESVFDTYERNIRKEYTWVPDDQFRAGRSAVLKNFLARPFIFSTEHFRKKYEVQARRNLQRSLAMLA